MTSRTILRTVSWLIGLAAIAASAHASAQGRELSIGSMTRFTNSSSARALSDGALAMFSVTGGYQVDWLRVPGFELLVDGTAEIGGMSGVTFQTLDTSTTVQLAALGARLRRDLASRWSGHARGNLGGARVSVDIEDMFNRGPALSDTAYTMTAHLGGGVEFLLGRRHGLDGTEQFSFGLGAELGYTAMVPVTLEATPESSGDDDIIRIPEMSASLGSLNLSAWGVRFGLFGRF
jgi:hypothetical protein